MDSGKLPGRFHIQIRNVQKAACFPENQGGVGI